MTMVEPRPAVAPPTSGSPLLSVEDLRVEFSTNAGTVRALDGVTLHIESRRDPRRARRIRQRQIVTAQAIMALLPKSSGRITGGRIVYDGVDLASQPVDEVSKRCGTEIAMVFQDPLSSLNPVFRVGVQVAEPFRRRRGMGRRASRRLALELLERVGIPDAERRIDDYPHQFSGGQRQRIMIAIALALGPDLLIADEPTTALDVTVQAQIMALLADLQRERGMAMMLITHDLGVVADIATRVAIMYAGRIVETGPIRDVYDNPAHPYTEGLLGSIPSEGQPGTRLTPIQGSPPSLLAVPSGCPFHPRCAYRADAVSPRCRCCDSRRLAGGTPGGLPPHRGSADR